VILSSENNGMLEISQGMLVVLIHRDEEQNQWDFKALGRFSFGSGALQRGCFSRRMVRFFARARVRSPFFFE
jgi:hypothetical protein